MVKDNNWVIHTHKAIARAQELLSLTIDMETAQRGYLITGDPVFLEPYHLALDVWPQKIQTLADQVSDNTPQVKRLQQIDQIHKTWLKESGQKEIMQRNLVNKGEADMESVVYLTQKQTGKQLIDKIRQEIAQFIEVETQLISVRAAKSESSANQTSYVLILGTLFSVFISLLVATWSSKRIKRRLHTLLEAANQVAAGHLKQGASTLQLDSDKNTQDEVAQLARSFQEMATNLVQSDLEMREKNHALIVERTKAEAAVKAKGEFLSTMSHEIRTPMNGVLGISQIIASQTQEPDTKENINLILDSGHHLMTILNDILDFSKVEENKLELDIAPFNFVQVMQPVCSALKPLADEKGIRLLIENNIPKNTQLIGDCARLRQIMFNLGGNATKFTKEGHVAIQADLNRANNQLTLTVTDTGIGIPKEKHEQVFNSFEQADTSTTRKFGGTGLGLAIVKNLVNLMNGEITLTSAVGLGTKFQITLPIAWQESKTTNTITPATNTEDLTCDSLSILLVEDNRINAIVAQGFCEKLGHHVEHAENGKLAIERLKTTQYDLILMDNHMPEMNGVETTHYIREKLKLGTLIFAYTADVFREAHDNFIHAGVDHVLTKPLQQESFFDALQQFSSRLPKQTGSAESASHSENIVELHRKPIETLRLTEEEISHSEVIHILKDDAEGFSLLIDSTIIEFEQSVDRVIQYYLAKELEPLCRTLHSIKGMSLNLGLNMLSKQALELEVQAKNQQLPDIELLQKLLNRLMVNIHQAQRMKNATASKYQNQVNDKA
ncbi:histidine kinase [Vibrio sp. 10N.261.46.E8]|nr:histidine kinase [Vibrio sp. 10N.261.45.E1]PMJ25195.1 histidine kinase [Vibrio sp. 10N.286.45.B6]PML88382.1 histidine kinase [Vibrio sp. 10N.261.49.E11]PMM70890.1 histidine kinase [Vibrio sp. 10N.261.46.F12]PMM80944.1 histidine kinase [Vibrio sp. 10N.261.46.E8]PMN43152.1 histidine kinase [Vibrio sp. 10N.261.45.E2]PMN58786.1 histidine kinase [Vibrio sp. 10N.261.45.E11]PMN79383.1 histidine kinase [Vibrio sp. 10N.261.45.A6]PMN82743.1 histidine kinase [Vibrio sp. 10N.261.45.A1]